MTPATPLTSRLFFGPIQRVLLRRLAASSTGYVLFDDAMAREIAVEAGIDPDHLEKHGTPEEGWKWGWKKPEAPGGVRRAITLAYQAMHIRKPALTDAGVRYQWSLTDAGRNYVDKPIKARAARKPKVAKVARPISKPVAKVEPPVNLYTAAKVPTKLVPSLFRIGMLKALAEASANTAGVETLKTDALVNRVVALSGFDPQNLGDYGWNWKDQTITNPDGSKRNLVGVNSKVGFCYLDMHRDTTGMAETTSGHKGKWGLTIIGRAEAMALQAKSAPIAPVVITEAIVKSDPVVKKTRTRSAEKKDALITVNVTEEFKAFITDKAGEVSVPSLVRSLLEVWVNEPVIAPTVVIEVKPTKPTNRNETSDFLNRRLSAPGSKLLDVLRKAISSKMQKSVNADLIDDHVNNCIEKLVRRNALKGRLDAGLAIPDHHIASWAIRSAIGDIRNDGTEPVAREMMGARTERERTKGIVLGDMTDNRLIWDKDEDGEVMGGTWADIEDTESPLTAQATEDSIYFGDVWGQLNGLMREVRTDAQGERYMKILQYKAAGMTYKEIAEKEGVTPHRATSLVAEAKAALMESLDEVDF